ncbi:hypothetical protein N7453_001992 [Penicillium expansum]|nr:hypothetical protein N7453_001992 [Penicillium expansum]
MESSLQPTSLELPAPTRRKAVSSSPTYSANPAANRLLAAFPRLHDESPLAILPKVPGPGNLSHATIPQDIPQLRTAFN